ncbi:MAG: helix-turn-helix domain-containing protein [Clostridia bacterium]|nr:helix-turn-helix domain-containing protein [Clostridia bacterium]
MYIISITNLNLLMKGNRFLVKNGWTHNGRKHNINILVYVEEGECTFFVNENKYQLEKNSYIIIPKGVFYKPYTETFCQYCYFNFFGEYVGHVLSTDDLSSVALPQDISLDTCFIVPEVGKATKKLVLHLHSIIDDINSNLTVSKMRINISLLNALNCISYDYDIRNKDDLASKIHQYIVENFIKPIDLSDISSYFGYSKQHIINQFKKGYNIPPNAFILQKRLELSSIYLLETSLTINEISSKCGFNDPNYYSRAFRAKYNMSPQKYRESFLNTH